MESNRLLPSRRYCRKIAAALGVTVEYLITGELPGFDNNDNLAYEVSKLPEKKRRVIQAVIDSLSAFD